MVLFSQSRFTNTTRTADDMQISDSADPTLPLPSQRDLPAYTNTNGTFSTVGDVDADAGRIDTNIPPPPHPHSPHAPHSPSRTPTTHRFDLQTSRAKPWLWMLVKSEAPNDKSLPVFGESDVVGSVEVELDNGRVKSVGGVIVSIKGAIIASGIDSRQFFEMSQVLWQPSMGPPIPVDTNNGDTSSPSSPPTSPTSTSQSPYTSTSNKHVKLTGRLSWPFSFTIPRYTSVSGKIAKDLSLEPGETFALPPTVVGRGCHAGVLYTIVVDVKKESVFATDRCLSTTIGYIPPSAPASPSSLRSAAYLSGTPLLGPSEDPEGWEVLPEVEMHGTAFKQRKVVVKLRLAFAKPLEYTRGSVIPLFLTLLSADEQVLDVLSHPHVPIVQMRKKIRAIPGMDAVGGALPPAESDAQLPLSKAQWWKPVDADGFEADEGQGKFKRALMGEMTVPKGLTPSFNFAKFDVKYVVDMYPFHAVGFEPANEQRLSRTEVGIRTLYLQDCPRPRAYLPPGYVSVQSNTSATGVGQLDTVAFM